MTSSTFGSPIAMLFVTLAAAANFGCGGNTNVQNRLAITSQAPPNGITHTTYAGIGQNAKGQSYSQESVLGKEFAFRWKIPHAEFLRQLRRRRSP